MGAAVITGALVLTACSGESAPDTHREDTTTASAEPSISESPTTEAPAVDPPTKKELLANPDLLATGYPTLPAGVEKIVDSVVQIDSDATLVTDYYDSAGNFVKSESNFAYLDKAKTVPAGGGGSGSVVETSNGKQVILTGGHVVAPNAETCAESTVNLQATSSADAESLVTYKQAMEYGGSRRFDTTKAPDKGVIITRGDTDRTPIPLLPKVSLDPGQVLFTANYEPTSEGDIRSPIYDGELKDPAVYNMMVLGKDSTTGMIAVLERGDSYGTMEENHSRKGASGGAVVDATGKLVATIEAGNDGTRAEGVAFELAMLAMNNNNPDLRNIEAKDGDTIEYIQPITQSDVDRIAAKAAQSDECTERPHKRVNLK